MAGVGVARFEDETNGSTEEERPEVCELHAELGREEDDDSEDDEDVSEVSNLLRPFVRVVE